MKKISSRVYGIVGLALIVLAGVLTEKNLGVGEVKQSNPNPKTSSVLPPKKTRSIEVSDNQKPSVTLTFSAAMKPSEGSSESDQ